MIMSSQIHIWAQADWVMLEEASKTKQNKKKEKMLSSVVSHYKTLWLRPPRKQQILVYKSM